MHLPKDRQGEEIYSEKTEDPLCPKGWPGIGRLNRDGSVVLREKATETSGVAVQVLPGAVELLQARLCFLTHLTEIHYAVPYTIQDTAAQLNLHLT